VLGVSKQRSFHNNDKLRLDRKRILTDVGFAWKAEAVRNYDPNHSEKKIWHQQYEFERKNGRCVVPTLYKQDASLGH
jgi:hypothetical protein